MAYLPTPKECRNHCGAKIYFDSNNPLSHPSAEKWVPLVYNEDTGVYTGEKHNCPKYSNGNGNGSSQQTQQQPQPQQDKLDKILLTLERMLVILEQLRTRQQ